MKSYQHYDLIRSPIITEKTTILSEQNKFTFHVADYAEKSFIKTAIEKIFAVKVKKVNIGRQSDKKKAIVTLQKDYTIDLTGGIK